MSAVAFTRRLSNQQIFDFVNLTVSVLSQAPRRYRWKPVKVPQPGIDGKSYRRIVHFKDEYTVEPLEVTNLAGRDPITGIYNIVFMKLFVVSQFEFYNLE